MGTQNNRRRLSFGIIAFFVLLIMQMRTGTLRVLADESCNHVYGETSIYWIETSAISGYDSDLPAYGAYRVCKKCYDVDVLDYVTATAVTSKEPTCVDVGEISYSVVFEYEGQEYTATDGTVIPATGNHTWNDGEITQEATCVSTGIRKYLCIYCGNEKSEDIPIDPANHKGSAKIVNETAPTETTDGYIGDTVCADCNTVLIQGTVIPKNGHHWNDGVITKQPTCVIPGVKTYTCTDCSETMTEEIAVDSSNHSGDTEIKNQLASTCISEGYSGDVYCCDCGALISKGVTIEKIAHSFGEWEELITPGCTTKGSKQRICERCGLKETETVSERGHEWDDGTITTEPTQKEDGIVTYTCLYCKETRQEPIAKLTAYQVIDSDGNSWESSDTDGYIFRINAEYDKFSELIMDGAVVDSTNYTIREGSTIITLNAEYMGTLSAGDHEIEAVFTDGEVRLNLNIEKKQTESTSENTPATSEAPHNESVVTDTSNNQQNNELPSVENVDSTAQSVVTDSDTSVSEADNIVVNDDTAVSEEEQHTPDANAVSDTEAGNTPKDDVENVHPLIQVDEKKDSERKPDTAASAITSMKSPKTGDNTDSVLFFIILMAGISGIIILLWYFYCKLEQVD